MKKSFKILAILVLTMLVGVVLDLYTDNLGFMSMATATIALADIPFDMGKPNGSGIGHYVYYVPLDDIASWPTIVDDMSQAETDAAYVGYTGDFTLKTGKYWIRIFNVQGEGEATSESTGEKCSKLFLNKLKYRFPKLTDAEIKKEKATVNAPGVYIVWEDGAYRVIGDKHYFGDSTCNITTGNSAGSSKGATLEVECPSFTPLPKYTGDIVLADGTLDCSTDVFTPAGSDED